MINNREKTRLRAAALAADEDYSRELQRAYGRSAGDARYRWRHDDPAVERAMHRKLAADAAWWKAQL